MVHDLQHEPETTWPDYRDLDSLVQAYEDRDKPVVHVLPQLLASRLTRLRRLGICDVDWSDWARARAHSSFFDLIPLFASVSTLRLSNCQFQTSSGVRRLVDISGLPRLRELSHHRSCTVSGHYRGSHHQTMPRPRLRLLRASRMTEWVLADLCNFLLACPSARSISRQNVSNIDRGVQDTSSGFTRCFYHLPARVRLWKVFLSLYLRCFISRSLHGRGHWQIRFISVRVSLATPRLRD